MKYLISRVLLKIIHIIYRLYFSSYWLICKNQFAKIGNNTFIKLPFISYGLENVFIGNNFTADKNLKIRTFTSFNGRQHFTPKIRIGDNVNMQTDCHISCISSIFIGDNTLLASSVYITDHFHGVPDYSDLAIAPIERNLFSKGGIHIGKNVWIGEKVTILPGVTIGDFSIIGANSVVTKNIPASSIACGIPAKVIKTIKP